MSGARRRCLATGIWSGTTMVGFAALAHASSGGSVDIGVVVVASVLAIALSAVVASRLPLTFWRAALLALAAQPLLHIAFERGTHPAPSVDHAGMHHHVDMASSGGGTDVRMLVAHMAVALATALVVRHGLQWLTSMPDLARAIVLVERRVIAPVPMRAGRIPALVGVAASPRPVSKWWDNRGPPV